MNFDNIQTAVELNADQQPSVYAALCMADAVIRDMEKAGCPPCLGDDKQAAVLWVRLSKWLLDIHNTNSAAFHNIEKQMEEARNQLVKKYEALEEFEQELRKYESEEHKKLLQNLKEEEKKLSKKVATLKKETTDLEQHNKEHQSNIEQLENTVAELCLCSEATEQFQKTAGRLETLTRVKAKLEQSVNAMETALESKQDRAAFQTMALRQRLQENLEALQSKVEAVSKAMQECADALTNLTKEETV